MNQLSYRQRGNGWPDRPEWRGKDYYLKNDSRLDTSVRRNHSGRPIYSQRAEKRLFEKDWSDHGKEKAIVVRCIGLCLFLNQKGPSMYGLQDDAIR